MSLDRHNDHTSLNMQIAALPRQPAQPSRYFSTPCRFSTTTRRTIRWWRTSCPFRELHCGNIDN